MKSWKISILPFVIGFIVAAPSAFGMMKKLARTTSRESVGSLHSEHSLKSVESAGPSTIDTRVSTNELRNLKKANSSDALGALTKRSESTEKIRKIASSTSVGNRRVHISTDSGEITVVPRTSTSMPLQKVPSRESVKSMSSDFEAFVATPSPKTAEETARLERIAQLENTNAKMAVVQHEQAAQIAALTTLVGDTRNAERSRIQKNNAKSDLFRPKGVSSSVPTSTGWSFSSAISSFFSGGASAGTGAPYQSLAAAPTVVGLSSTSSVVKKRLGRKVVPPEIK